MDWVNHHFPNLTLPSTLILNITLSYGPDVGIYFLETFFYVYNHLHSFSSVGISKDRENEFEENY